MLNIVTCVEYTTRNARRMKYYKITLVDGTVQTLTRDYSGNLYLEGQPVTNKEDSSDLARAINNSVTLQNLSNQLAKKREARFK